MAKQEGWQRGQGPYCKDVKITEAKPNPRDREKSIAADVWGDNPGATSGASAIPRSSRGG